MSELKRTEEEVLQNLESVNVVFLPEQMAPGNSPCAREQVPAAKGRGRRTGLELTSLQAVQWVGSLAARGFLWLRGVTD